MIESPCCESAADEVSCRAPSNLTHTVLYTLSRLTCVEKAVKNTTIIVIYKVLVYIQMSQPTTCFGLF